MARRNLPLAALIAVAALAAFATPAHAAGLGPEEPHSPNAETIATAHWVMLGLAIVLSLVVNVALVVAVARFRGRRGRRPSRFAAGRGAFRPVLAALTVLALAVFVFGVVVTEDAREIEPTGPDGLGSTRSTQVGVKEVPSDPAPLEIRAIAQQWLWRFEYPGGQPGQRSFSYGELVVPVDTAVVLNVDSTDVIHSWWVPALGGQVQATPGQLAKTWFKADEVGRYPGRSTIFSGSAYPAMRSWVRVVTASEYETYVAELGADLREAQGIVQQAQRQAAAQ